LKEKLDLYEPLDLSNLEFDLLYKIANETYDDFPTQNYEKPNFI